MFFGALTLAFYVISIRAKFRETFVENAVPLYLSFNWKSLLSASFIKLDTCLVPGDEAPDSF